MSTPPPYRNFVNRRCVPNFQHGKVVTLACPHLPTSRFTSVYPTLVWSIKITKLGGIKVFNMETTKMRE